MAALLSFGRMIPSIVHLEEEKIIIFKTLKCSILRTTFQISLINNLDAAYWAQSVFSDSDGDDNGFFEYLALGHDKWKRDPKEGPKVREVINSYNILPKNTIFWLTVESQKQHDVILKCQLFKLGLYLRFY